MPAYRARRRWFGVSTGVLQRADKGVLKTSRSRPACAQSRVAAKVGSGPLSQPAMVSAQSYSMDWCSGAKEALQIPTAAGSRQHQLL